MRSHSRRGRTGSGEGGLGGTSAGAPSRTVPRRCEAASRGAPGRRRPPARGARTATVLPRCDESTMPPRLCPQARGRLTPPPGWRAGSADRRGRRRRGRTGRCHRRPAPRSAFARACADSQPMIAIGRVTSHARRSFRTLHKCRTRQPRRAMGFSKYDRRVVRALDHVQVMMPEGGEDDARRFYAGILGLTEVEKPEPMQANGGVWFAEGIHVSGEGGVLASSPGTPGAARRRHRLAGRGARCSRLRGDLGRALAGGAAVLHAGPIRQPRGNTVRHGFRGGRPPVGRRPHPAGMSWMPA